MRDCFFHERKACKANEHAESSSAFGAFLIGRWPGDPGVCGKERSESHGVEILSSCSNPKHSIHSAAGLVVTAFNQPFGLAASAFCYAALAIGHASSTSESTRHSDLHVPPLSFVSAGSLQLYVDGFYPLVISRDFRHNHS